jgi:hypothetical protein
MIAWMKRKTEAHKIHPLGMLLLLTAGTLPLAGCITLAAPDKPIVIELNINIQQEVVYRLDGDAKNLIEENEDIF